jgi:hypothetical protein
VSTATTAAPKNAEREIMKIRHRITGFLLSVPAAAALMVGGGGVAHAAGPGDVVFFHNVGSDQCAQSLGGGNGVRVVQRPCDPANDNQKWVLSQIGGVYEFVNVGASKCMDVTDGKNADHTPIQLWGCNGSTSMRWTADPGFGGVAQVKSETGGRCLDVFGGDGAQLQLIHCTGFGNLAQVWRFPLA